MKGRLIIVVLLAAMACGGDNPTGADDPTALEKVQDCSVLGQTRAVRAILQDGYLWYRDLPDPDPASFARPEDYLAAVRYRPLDTSYSYIASRAESEAFFSESQSVGFGFSATLAAIDDLRVVYAYGGSPAAEAGLERGARILTFNGYTVAQIVAAGGVGAVAGPRQAGVSGHVRFIDRSGREREATMVKRTITIPPVAVTRTYRVGTRTVGYIFFEHFVEPSRAALDAAFAQLRAEGANELVLDVRYNGGGLLSIAQHLGGLIGGSRTRGQIFVRIAHNDKNTSRDVRYEFPAPPPQALGLERLVVITTDGSASASELIINGLRPFMNVTIVGERTFGKPVGQYGHDICDKTLYPVEFATLNARNEGDYFNGLAADCPAPDDIGHAFGDPAEGSLAEALSFIRTGRCSPSAGLAARASSQRRPPAEHQPHREDGWQLLLGFY